MIFVSVNSWGKYTCTNWYFILHLPPPQPDPPQVDLGKLGGMLKSIHHSIRLRNKSTNMATITDNVLKEVYTHVSASWIWLCTFSLLKPFDICIGELPVYCIQRKDFHAIQGPLPNYASRLLDRIKNDTVGTEWLMTVITSVLPSVDNVICTVITWYQLTSS